MRKILPILILLFPTVAMADTLLTMKSDTGDWIGGGKDYNLPQDFTSVQFGRSLISLVHPNGFRFNIKPSDNRDLGVGAFLNAERTPFRGPLNPGIEVSSSGRGCNKISGEFYIYEFVEDEKLALDFVQFCDSTVSKLTGSIRINSDISSPYDKPTAVAETSQSRALEGSTIELTAERSLTVGSAITGYNWQQISGPDVVIFEANAETTNIELPIDVDLGGEMVKLELTVTDEASNTSSSSLEIEIQSKSDPHSYFWMKSEAGDYIGAGRDWEYDESNGTITMSRNYDNGVNVSINSSDWWSANFAAPDDVELTTGVYSYAERFPFQNAGVAGLTISGNGRGCNKNYGNFTILSLDWRNETPTNFKASFEQTCESTTAPLLVGEVAVNALHESVPVADAGGDIEVKENEFADLDGSGSFDNLGTIAGYEWSSPDVSINSADQSRANFIAPTLANREASRKIQVTLLIRDNENYKAKDSVMVTVVADNQVPVAADDTASVAIGGAVEIRPISNDSDADGAIQIDSISVETRPNEGSYITSSDGVITYTHTGTEVGTDTILYTIKDNDAGTSNAATITIEIAEQEPEQDSDSEPDLDSGSSGGSIGIGMMLVLVLTTLVKYRGRSSVY